MRSDSHLAAIAAHRIGADDPPEHGIDRSRFLADVNQLELRLAIIDDRFDRFASRSDEIYQDWRRDTVTKARELALRARALEDAGALESHHRRRVAAVLVTIRARIVALDGRRTVLMGRRTRADDLRRRQAMATGMRRA